MNGGSNCIMIRFILFYLKFFVSKLTVGPPEGANKLTRSVYSTLQQVYSASYYLFIS